MKKSDYVRIFDSFIDNDISCGVLLIGSIPISDKLEILENVSQRLQIEFGKEVCLITNEIPKEKSELKVFNQSDSPFDFVPDNDCIFLCLLKKPYFDNNGWYSDMLSELTYYNRTFLGFTTGEQKIVFYE